MNESSQEREKQARIENKRMELQKKATEEFGIIFDKSQSAENRAEIIIERLGDLLNSEFVDIYAEEGAGQRMIDDLIKTALIEERQEFVSASMQVLKSLIDILSSHAKEFEDYEAMQIMKAQGFTQLNDRISYSVGGGQLQLHLAPAYEVKDQIEAMYRDGLEKVVAIVKADPTITTIGGSSWINATKTYGNMKERLGFVLLDTPQEVIEEHFKYEDRPIKDAKMTREEFLKIYDSK